MRLQASLAYLEDENFVRGFVAPSPIQAWERYLVQIRPRLNNESGMPPRHARNIGYRIQLMEFECGLLIFDFEVKGRFPGSSTLHETVSRMKMQQYVVLVNGVLEGVGAHLSRIKDLAVGLQVDDRQMVTAQKWKLALAEEVSQNQPHQAVPVADLEAQLGMLTTWRDRVHLDRVENDGALHFEEFTYEGCFLPTYRTFRDFMNTLNAQWPEGTCLNEPI